MFNSLLIIVWISFVMLHGLDENRIHISTQVIYAARRLTKHEKREHVYKVVVSKTAGFLNNNARVNQKSKLISHEYITRIINHHHSPVFKVTCVCLLHCTNVHRNVTQEQTILQVRNI